jgi:hypothetical protein
MDDGFRKPAKALMPGASLWPVTPAADAQPGLFVHRVRVSSGEERLNKALEPSRLGGVTGTASSVN